MDEHALRAVDGGLEQGGFYGLLDGLDAALVALGDADAHVRHAAVLHDGADILKVAVDEGGLRDHVGDALHALAEYVVRHLEGVVCGHVACDLQHAVVRDDDERIHDPAELVYAVHGVLHAGASLKEEGLRHDAEGENAHVLGGLGDYGSGARAGASAHAGGDEDEIGPAHELGDLLNGFLRRGFALFGLRAGAEALGDLLADLELDVRLGIVERLLIGVDGDEFYVVKTGFDHAVDRVAARAADADDLELGKIAGFVVEFKIKCHNCFLRV